MWLKTYSSLCPRVPHKQVSNLPDSRSQRTTWNVKKKTDRWLRAWWWELFPLTLPTTQSGPTTQQVDQSELSRVAAQVTTLKTQITAKSHEEPNKNRPHKIIASYYRDRYIKLEGTYITSSFFQSLLKIRMTEITSQCPCPTFERMSSLQSHHCVTNECAE